MKKTLKKTLMEKEIFEQAEVIKKLMNTSFELPSGFCEIKLIASGSSYNCARLGEKFFEDMAQIHCTCDFSSELLAKKSPVFDKKTLYVFVSQSGETLDTLEVLKKIKKLGLKTVVVTNVKTSTMAKMADYKIFVNAGEENAIAATKSFSACVFGLYLCAIEFAKKRKKNVSKFVKNLKKIPLAIEKILENEHLQSQIKKAAKFLSRHKSFPVIGYDYYYILAKEGALKIKETSYIDSNAYALGEFIHGHIALLNQKNVVLEIFTSNMGRFEFKNLMKIKKDYKPEIVAITDYASDLDIKSQIVFERDDEISTIFSVIVILQLLALEIAKCLKRNIDKPIGLSKVVRE